MTLDIEPQANKKIFMLNDNICAKCGGLMKFRRYIKGDEVILIKQCIVCRHYIIADNH
ncbi:MAG: hypothetical protein ACTSVL_10240 [Promethearchaeota archaeon]